MNTFVTPVCNSIIKALSDTTKLVYAVLTLGSDLKVFTEIISTTTGENEESHDTPFSTVNNRKRGDFINTIDVKGNRQSQNTLTKHIPFIHRETTYKTLFHVDCQTSEEYL